MAISKIPSAGFQDNVKFRNLIINGGMDIAQRGTSFSVSDNIYTLDRFLTEFSGFGAFTLTQSTDSPDGFGHSLKLDCTTADASPASGDVFQLFHKIEGQNLQYLKKGTSSAESTTVSFFVKSNKTGNMQVNLRDAPNNRIIGGVYTINTANTWEKKTITFAGDTSGAIDNDNTEGLSLEFPIGSGSDNSSGSVPTTWQTKDNADRNAGSTINLADSTSNEWYVTGIQLEAGSVASDFEFLPVDVNLKRCERYCQLIVSGDSRVITNGAVYSTSQAYGAYMFRQRMRASPSFTQTTGSGYYRFRNRASDEHVSSFAFANTSDYSTRVNATSSGMTVGDAGWFTANSSSSKIISDAEL